MVEVRTRSTKNDARSGQKWQQAKANESSGDSGKVKRGGAERHRRPSPAAVMVNNFLIDPNANSNNAEHRAKPPPAGLLPRNRHIDVSSSCHRQPVASDDGDAEHVRGCALRCERPSIVKERLTRSVLESRVDTDIDSVPLAARHTINSTAMRKVSGDGGGWEAEGHSASSNPSSPMGLGEGGGGSVAKAFLN